MLENPATTINIQLSYNIFVKEKELWKKDMDLNIKISNLGFEDISDLGFKCRTCTFWFECSRIGIIKEFQKSPKFLDFIKLKLFEIKNRSSSGLKLKNFINNGGIIKIAHINKSDIKGIAVYGNYYLFPKLKEFNVYPPGNDSIFIACMFIDPDYADFGIAERLLLSIEKDSLNFGIKSIETIAKRQNEDISDEEFENLHLIPFKFLIKHGFLIKKNDNLFPLLRLDLTMIETVLNEEDSLFARLFAKKEFNRSTLIRIKSSESSSDTKSKN